MEDPTLWPELLSLTLPLSNCFFLGGGRLRGTDNAVGEWVCVANHNILICSRTVGALLNIIFIIYAIPSIFVSIAGRASVWYCWHWISYLLVVIWYLPHL